MAKPSSQRNENVVRNKTFSKVIIRGITMEFKSEIRSITQDLDTTYLFTATVPKTQVNSLVGLKGEGLSIQVGKEKRKRSLNANAYAWVLLTKIAEELSKEQIIDKWTVYKNLLKKYSNSFVYMVVKKDALPGIKKVFRAVEVLAEQMMGDQDTLQLQCYFGSSTFTKEEMKTFLDGVVLEAKELGIDTENPEEIDRLIGLWEG